MGFYLLPGSAVLELRGGSAVLCGALPGAEAGRNCRAFWLSACDAVILRTEHPLTLPGWQPAAPLTLWDAAQGPAPCRCPAAGALPDKAPSMLPVSRLVFAESDAEADEILLRGLHGAGPRAGHLPRAAAQRQTRLHGGLLRAERYRELHGRGVTDPAWQGRGLARLDCRAGE